MKTIALGLLSLLLFTASAQAEAAPSSVSILPYAHGYFGEVESPGNPGCEANRRVVVSVRKAGSKKFRTIGSRKTFEASGRLNPNRGDRMWRLPTKARGTIKARAKGRPGCSSSTSDRIASISRNRKGLPRSQDVPSCPSEDSTYCRLDQLHFDTGICPSFTAFAGICGGSVYGPSNWRSGGGRFHWSERVGNYLEVEMSAYSLADMSVDDWKIFGAMSGPNKAEWMVTDAFNKRGGGPVRHWQAADMGVAPGQMGGPLFLNFVNGITGADVYVHGYLYRKD